MQKKILVISPFMIFPPYWGGARRTYHLTKNLAKSNRVFLLCNEYSHLTDTSSSQCDEYYEMYNMKNVSMYFAKTSHRFSQIFNHKLIFQGLNIIRREKPDIILAEFAWTGPTALLLSILAGVPYVLDEHNVEYVRFERMKKGNRISRLILKHIEKISCWFASRVLCVSEVDRDMLISSFGIRSDKLVIIPNGVDINKFYPNPEVRDALRKQLQIAEETKIILFFGKLDYYPNAEAVEIIKRELLPRILPVLPDVKFFIVGDGGRHDTNHENLLFAGLVDKIEDYINASDIVICPLLSGGGTRLKIIEALACGKVVVSTTIGAEGLVCDDTSCLRIADDWDEFVAQMVLVLVSEHYASGSEYCSSDLVKRYCWCSVVREIICSFH